jgi:hypothetical protein
MDDLLHKVHLSSSLLREVLDLIRDLASMRDMTPEEVLDSAEIKDAANDASRSAAQRGEAVHRFLRRERNPRFVRAKQGFESEKRKLNLPRSVKISPDPYFETSYLRVEFDSRSLEDYKEAVAALQKASGSSSLKSLFRIDG